jgi:hypothetical protein
MLGISRANATAPSGKWRLMGSNATFPVAPRDYTIATISCLFAVGPAKIRTCTCGKGEGSSRAELHPPCYLHRRSRMIQWSSLKKQKARAELLPRVFNAGT